MTIDSEVYAIASGAAERVYPIKLPMEVILPAVTYTRVSRRNFLAHDGTVLIRPLFQLTAWSNDSKSAREVGRDVIAAFEPMVGYANVENTRDLYDPGQRLHGFAVEVRVTGPAEDDYAS